MIETVTKPTIGELLSPEGPTVFKIPRYQREYTWGQHDWENLFDDVMDNPIGYFLGSIIVIDHGHNAESSITELEVIDGQQRLTTISILLTALYAQLNAFKGVEFNPEEDEDTYTTYLNLKRRLLFKNKKGKTRVIPQTQGTNLADYRSLLTEYAALESNDPKPKGAGLRRIYKAYRYFEKRIAEKLEQNDNKVAALCGLITKICSAVIVDISVSNHSDAYVLFESLNNRGIPLTAVDLIKNSLLANLDAEDEEELDGYFNQWQNILTLLGNDYKTEERFFRQNYDAFRRQVNAPFATAASKYPLGAVATKSNLLDIYEKQIKRDPVALLGEVTRNAAVYSRILLREGSDEMSVSLVESLSDLAHVQGVPSYLILLYLMRNEDSLGLTDDELAKICDLLVRFFVRRNLTDTPPTRDLARMFIRIIESIEDSACTGSAIYDYVRDQLVAVSSVDSVFEASLRDSIYEINPDITRYILTSLAKPSVTKEMRGLWDRSDSGLYVWTIEHIFPQGANIPQSWVEMMADGDQSLAKEIQDEYVHMLGNLTLTGYNSTLGNQSFIEKRDRKDRDGNSVGYKNGLNINAEIAERESWDKQAIQNRTDKLVKECMQAFAL